jgi:small GTP-binding protein
VRELTKKVCLLGDFYVGKTSLVRRFVEGRFDERYLSSIGVKVDRRVMHVPADEGDVALTLMLWDLASESDGGHVVPSYYRGASGAILVCDLTRPDTLSSVGHYAERLLATNPEAALVLAANKVDLEQERRVAEEDLAAAAAELRAPLYHTSARTGAQVEDMFQQLGVLLLQASQP